MWVIKAVLVVLAVAVACGFGFLVAFPWLLRKNNPLRPLDAYGWTAATVLAGSTLIVVGSYWEEMSLASPDANGSWLARHGLRFAVAAVGCALAVGSRWLFRSETTPA